METLGVAIIVAQVRKTLKELGFAPRDADPTDYQKGSDNTLRFKTGTSRGEVAVHILEAGRANEVLRIVQPHHLDDVLRRVAERIADHGASRA